MTTPGANPPSDSPAPEQEPAPERSSTDADHAGQPDRSGKPWSRWQEMHLWQIQPVRDVLLVLGIILLFRLGYEISIVTVPLLLALLLAYLFEPLVAWMVKNDRMRREVASFGIIGVVAVAVLVPLTIASVVAFTQVIKLADNVADNTSQVVKSLANYNDREAFNAIEDSSWKGVRNFVVRISQEQEDIEQAREALLEKTRADRGAEAAAEASNRDDASDPATDPGTGAANGRTSDAANDPANAPTNEGSTEPASDEASDAEQSAEIVIDEDELFRHLPVGQFYSPQLGGIISGGLETLQSRSGAIAGAALASGEAAIEAVFAGVASIGKIAFMGFLTAMFFFFISSSYARVLNFSKELVPDAQQERFFDLVGKMDRVVSAFVRGRITIAVILTVFLTIGYWVIGAPAPFLLGPVVGVLSIAPYISLLGLPITIGAMFVDPQGTFGVWQTQVWWILLGPFLVYQLAQILDDYVLTPSIQGKAVGMDTPTILFAVLAGGALAGIYGVLIAIPVAACVKILLREVFWPNFKAWTHGDAPDFLPIGRGQSNT